MTISYQENFTLAAAHYLSYVVIASHVFAVTTRTYWLGPPVIMFVIVPALDSVIPKLHNNQKDKYSVTALQRLVYDMALEFYLPAYVLALSLTASQLDQFTDKELLACVINLGIIGGIGAIAAHELLHRPDSAARASGSALLSLILYSHFPEDHRYHHLHVGLPEDNETSRLNEPLPEFLLRATWGSYSNTYQTKPTYIIGHVVWQISLITIVYWRCGFMAAYVFVMQAAVAIYLLQTVNYIEHYGLSRKEVHRPDDQVCWNDDNTVSTLIFFKLQRHSHHHINAMVPYYNLDHKKDVPMMPFGYPSMILLASIPPVWYMVMNPYLAEMQAGNTKTMATTTALQQATNVATAQNVSAVSEALATPVANATEAVHDAQHTPTATKTPKYKLV